MSQAMASDETAEVRAEDSVGVALRQDAIYSFETSGPT